jgi:hypothetical protein
MPADPARSLFDGRHRTLTDRALAGEGSFLRSLARAIPRNRQCDSFRRSSRPIASLRIVVLSLAVLSFPSTETLEPHRPRVRSDVVTAGDVTACEVKELKKSDAAGVLVYAPDGERYALNKEDRDGIAQIYVGRRGSSDLACISCTQQPGGPKPSRFKMQPRWHPSGRWIVVPVERDKYSRPPILGWSRKYVEGQLRNGLWTNMYAVAPDGRRWFRLTEFRDKPAGTPNGFTGPAFTSDGMKAVWSQIVDGNILKYWPFGRWELILADFEESDGTPRLANQRDITPPGMHWNEVGNFHPDNESMLLSGSVERDAQGMDQYVLNIGAKARCGKRKSDRVHELRNRRAIRKVQLILGNTNRLIGRHVPRRIKDEVAIPYRRHADAVRGTARLYAVRFARLPVHRGNVSPEDHEHDRGDAKLERHHNCFCECPVGSGREV